VQAGSEYTHVIVKLQAGRPIYVVWGMDHDRLVEMAAWLTRTRFDQADQFIVYRRGQAPRNQAPAQPAGEPPPNKRKSGWMTFRPGPGGQA
jgi:hypothetical protein